MVLTTTQKIFYPPTLHPNSEELSIQLPSHTTILNIIHIYSAYFRLPHTAITVNSSPARVYIANAVRLHQLTPLVIISHAPASPISLLWPWPPSITQVVCLPQYTTTFCGRSHTLHLDSNMPIHCLPTQFANHAWCCPHNSLHIFWLTSFATAKALQDIPGPLSQRFRTSNPSF